ncbi:MAG: hypothetical protein AAGD14_01875 [Planctomycetota bacterium]
MSELLPSERDQAIIEGARAVLHRQFDTLVRWFLFFLPIMLGTVGIVWWKVQTHSDLKLANSWASPALWITLFFALQGGLGIVACWSFRREAERVGLRIEALLKQHDDLASGHCLLSLSPLFDRATFVAIISLAANVFLLLVAFAVQIARLP